MFQTVEQLMEEIPESKRHLLKQISFVIIRPDALARGYERQLLEDFANNGLFVVGFKYVFVDERQMEELYRYTQHKMLENQMRPLWWMTREMYRTSPALLLLLAGPFPDEFADCSLFVESLKGPSNPTLTKPEHLRYRYRSMNVVLCTIHSSDDTEQSVRESRIFFSQREFMSALEHVPVTLEGRKPGPHHYLEKAVDRWYGRTRRPGSFFEILGIMKIRILAHLLGCPGLNVEVLRELYDDVLEIALQRLPYVEESEKIHQLLDRELEILRIIEKNMKIQANLEMESTLSEMEMNDRFLLLEALRMLADYKSFENVSFIQFREIIRRNLVVMDDWESLVLETSMIFHMIQLRGYYIK